MTQPLAPAAPNLPLSPAIPDRIYMDQLTNAQRLYYNRIDSSFQTLFNYKGGSILNFPYAAIQRTTDKSFTINTPTQITFDQNDYLNGCTNDGTDGIHVDIAGVYNYQFSVQLKNADTQIHSAWIWLRVNGVDLAGTGSKFDVTAKHGGVDGFVIAACNFYVSLQAQDYVEMYAAVDNANITFDATGASTSPFAMPAIPSVVATLSFVSSPPA